MDQFTCGRIDLKGRKMKIIQVKIKNFRSYANEIVVDFGDLTAFVGKNDMGKSTILEALDIFFDGGVIKIDKNDINKECTKNGDNEIQNPLKSAVAQIFKDEKISKELQTIAEEVIRKLQEVTDLTLEKLKDMNPEIAKTLNPKIPTIEQLKWADVFKSVSIAGDEDIPINKRGSGVKRMILLNFFRAEAERKKNNNEKSNIIYAIEEPETSQHQYHQRLLMEALKNLSKEEGVQIIITTHSPNIVKQLQFENIRVVKNNENIKEIVKLEKHVLPIPSLNEANYLAFGEADEEYHNELYGCIDSRGLLDEYFKDKPQQKYKEFKDGKIINEYPITKTKYIRNQIHHPENTHNPKFTFGELQQSIKDMRDFIQASKGNQQ